MTSGDYQRFIFNHLRVKTLVNTVQGILQNLWFYNKIKYGGKLQGLSGVTLGVSLDYFMLKMD